MRGVNSPLYFCMKGEFPLAIIGLDAFGIDAFKSYSPPVRNINNIEMKNAIYDEVHIREKTSGIDLTPTKEDWQMDTLLLAKFLGDLEAGNINNQGVKIVQFAIKRRKVNELNSITVGHRDFINNSQFVFEDYTQPNDEFVYSIVPVGENGLEGQENSINVKSDFAGYFLVDRFTNEVLEFDKFIGSENNMSTNLNQNRTQIETLAKYPSFFYGDANYHTFSLQSVFIPEEWETSDQVYQSILNKYIYSHKPFIVKGGNGSIYIVDVSSPSVETPQNVYRGRDYMTMTVQCTEIMDYKDYMNL